MISPVFLSDGRDQDLILDIIVDHGLGQDLVRLRIPGQMAHTLVHKGGDLVHIQIDPGNVVGTYEFHRFKDLPELFPGLFLSAHRISSCLVQAPGQALSPVPLACLAALACRFISLALSRAASEMEAPPRSLASSLSLSSSESLVIWVMVLPPLLSLAIR